MKRKFTALIAIAAIVLTCVPVFSGCSGKQVYTLKEDEQGKYYSVSYSGYSPSLKGRLEIPAELTFFSAVQEAKVPAGSSVTPLPTVASSSERQV